MHCTLDHVAVAWRGVYNQFRNMAQKQDPKVSPVPTKLSIKGNILSIFLCWSIGLSAAFVVFAIRDTRSILQVLRNGIICLFQMKIKTVDFFHVYISKITITQLWLVIEKFNWHTLFDN